MRMGDAGEMAREMERVCRALAQAGILLAGHDQAESARQLSERPAYSPLRTLVEQAEESAKRVMQHLRQEGACDASPEG
ncbi:hypothetical protein ACQPZJ_01875 [Actinoplanes sp. CA-054009]